MMAVVLVTFSMIIVFSALNGFEGLVKSLYNSFYPEIIIQPAVGKVFEYNEDLKAKLANTEGVLFISETLEEKALIKNGDQQVIATIKGVDEIYTQVTQLKDRVVRGKYLLNDQYHNNYVILGAGLEYRLGVNVSDQLEQLKVYLPRRGRNSSILPSQAFVSRSLFPAGAFSIQSDFDMKYAIVPLAISRELLKYDDNIVSQLELKINSTKSLTAVQESIKVNLGTDYIVKNQFEQNETLYQVMRLESWAVYFILSLILILAVFNIAGFLIMLLLDKKKDIFILKSMGADRSMIQNIFIYEGLTISFLGCFIGLILSIVIISLQQHFGFIKIEGATFVVSTYPFEMKWIDFVVVGLTVLGISFIAAYLPTRRIAHLI